MPKLLVNLAHVFCISLISTSQVHAEDSFPSHPVRIIVNTGPGGLLDVTTRLIAQQMSLSLKQSVIVENRAGGDGLVGINVVKEVRPDGYTLLASAGTMVYQQSVRQDPGYNLLSDFTGIGFIGRSPLLLEVSTGEPEKTLSDFISRAKANPGKLSYASAGIGTGTHLGAALYLQKAGLQLLHVPYKGNGPAMPDVMSGRVNMIFEAYGSSKGYLDGGKLRALGVTSNSRLTALPNVPTLAEQGAPGYSFYTWMGLVAPAGTPKDAVERLSQALRDSINNNSLRERLASQGIETSPMTPPEFNKYLRNEVSEVNRVVTNLGIQKQ
ncbi:tripartite tricarboxylate transporter substrate binding protein [Caballeronia sp. BR00000012568055]|uniref:Bug family tripartite tricarboxylate transporter substrate binding protein n=1 Tax=Caballeronia sp. BR00000012568055 TaxID=2918761 RepID=UPI0023F7AA3A|nr:tripartite tricarboxylate transporter substrate binding protein [Caballeronia sp. BR00000012568055]